MKSRVFAIIALLSAVAFKVSAQEVQLIKECNCLPIAHFPVHRSDSILAIDNYVVKYNNVLFLKFKQGRENYIRKPIHPVDKNRYELLDKGAFYIGAVLGFDEISTENKMFQPFVTMDGQSKTSLDIELVGAYLVSKNFAVGGRIGYGFLDGRTTLHSPTMELVFQTTSMEFNKAATNFSAGLFIKNFIPVDKAKRIFITNETRLGYAHMHSLERDTYKEGNLVRKHELNRHTIGLGITPGFMYFLSRQLAVEFMISPVMLYYQYTSITNDEIESGKVEGGGTNFMLSPLRMNFGVSYFFGLNYK